MWIASFYFSFFVDPILDTNDAISRYRDTRKLCTKKLWKNVLVFSVAIGQTVLANASRHRKKEHSICYCTYHRYMGLVMSSSFMCSIIHNTIHNARFRYNILAWKCINCNEKKRAAHTDVSQWVYHIIRLNCISKHISFAMWISYVLKMLHFLLFYWRNNKKKNIIQLTVSSISQKQ